MAVPHEFVDGSATSGEVYNTGSLGPEGRLPNPFSAEHSGYGSFVGDDFVSVYPEGSDMHEFHLDAHTYVREYVLGETELPGNTRFPCVFGEAAFRSKQYAFSAYDEITEPATAEGMLHDIVKAQTELEIPAVPPRTNRMYRTTLLAFRKPEIQDERHGATVLYTLLRNLHELNARHYVWAEGFSNDPESTDFGFSAGESAHFIAYFHPEAAVPARRTEVPFIVVNSHHVVYESKQKHGIDHHNRTRDLIRDRQSKPTHSALGNHGDVPDMDQYALVTDTPEARAADRALRREILGECPFEPAEMDPEKQEAD